ncbi:MAG: hypothetical protein IPM54_25095 [Polyangiaceae bacterium]|nr:hypothetical protein [Polyangiaceae bacterium]
MRLLEAIASPWTWILILLYLVFLGNERLKVHGILDTAWRGAQEVGRVADRLGAIEKKLDKVIEAKSAPDDSSIRISIPK